MKKIKYILFFFLIQFLEISCRFFKSEILISTMRKNGGWAFLDRMGFDGEVKAVLNLDIISIRKEISYDK